MVLSALALLLLLLVTFLIRFLPRVSLPNAIVSDTYFHLYCAELIRSHKMRIPKKLPGVMLPHEYTYPFGYHWLLALFPQPARGWVERGTAACFDTINTAIVYAAGCWFFQRAGLDAPATAALVAAAVYSFSPALLRIGSGPRAYNGSARVPGQTLYMVHLLAAYHGLLTQAPVSLAISVLAGAILLFSAIFSTQVLVFFATAIAVVVSPWYLAIVAGSLLLSALMTGGHTFVILRATIGHLSLYYSHLQQIFLYPHIRTWGGYARAVRDLPKAIGRGQFKVVRDWYFNERFHWHIVVTAFPQLLALPLAYRSPLDAGDLRFLAWWSFAGVICFWLTKRRALLFLGEGERYLEAIVVPSILLLVSLTWTDARWLLFVLLAYSMLAAVYYGHDYLTRYGKPLHDDHVASDKLFARMASLPAGNVLPVGWIHWLAVQRCPFPVLTYGGNVDTRVLSVEEFLLVYGAYPYPGKDYHKIVDTYGIQYVLAERSCLDHYVNHVMENGKSFWDSVVLLEEAPTTMLFVKKSYLVGLGEEVNRTLGAGDFAGAKRALKALIGFEPDSAELKEALVAVDSLAPG